MKVIETKRVVVTAQGDEFDNPAAFHAPSVSVEPRKGADDGPNPARGQAA